MLKTTLTQIYLIDGIFSIIFLIKILLGVIIIINYKKFLLLDYSIQFIILFYIFVGIMINQFLHHLFLTFT